MRRSGIARGLLAGVLLPISLGAAQAQWEIQNSTTTADLRGVASAGGGVAWASGTNGTVLRTEDGGFEWQSCSMPPGAEHLDFRGVVAFDANTAIVMSSGKGDLSRLYKTTDGCHTWKLLFRNPDAEGFWDAVQFETEQLGWLLGDPVDGAFYLARTFDGGLHWIRQQNASLAAEASRQGAFAASNASLFEYYGHALFVTGGKAGAFVFDELKWNCADGCGAGAIAADGKNAQWRRVPVPVGRWSEASGIFAVGGQRTPPLQPVLGLALVAVGGDYSHPDEARGTAAFAPDGKTWIPAQTTPRGYRSAVAYDAASKTWIAVGPNGTDISTDEGWNWRALKPNPALHEAADADRNWNALSLPFAVGPHGRIGKLRAHALRP